MFAVVPENDVDVARRIDRRDRDRQIAALQKSARAGWREGCVAWNSRGSTKHVHEGPLDLFQDAD
jgi:hypothetical protein